MCGASMAQKGWINGANYFAKNIARDVLATNLCDWSQLLDMCDPFRDHALQILLMSVLSLT